MWVNVTGNMRCCLVAKIDELTSMYFYEDGDVAIHEFKPPEDTVELSMEDEHAVSQGWERLEATWR
jgi:hypothetical protein